ncbi:MAG: hypothetical protein IPL01_08660 [Acidobacteria bacterium]|nr:hypothetical protein [Acidobacteriota bacterium]
MKSYFVSGFFPVVFCATAEDSTTNIAKILTATAADTSLLPEGTFLHIVFLSPLITCQPVGKLCASNHFVNMINRGQPDPAVIRRKTVRSCVDCWAKVIKNQGRKERTAEAHPPSAPDGDWELKWSKKRLQIFSLCFSLKLGIYGVIPLFGQRLRAGANSGYIRIFITEFIYLAGLVLF